MLLKLLIFLVIFAFSATNLNNPLLWFDSGAIANGEIWRIFSCNFIHSSPLHLFFNFGAFLVMLPFIDSRRDALFLFLCAWFVGLGLFLSIDPKYSYSGLSGLLYGAAAWLTWCERRSLPHKAILPVAFLLVSAKLFWDIIHFPSPSVSDPESVLIPHSHLFGFLGAVAWISLEKIGIIAGLRNTLKTVAVAFFIVSSLFHVDATASESQVSSVHQNSLSTIPWLSYRRLSFFVGIGFVRGSAIQDDIQKSVENAGVNLDSFSINVNRPGYHLGIAYELTDFLHLEGMYFNFGRVAVEASSSGITELELASAFQDRLPGTGAGPLLALKYNVWVGTPFHRLFARAGAFVSRSGYDLTYDASIKRQENSILLGGGYEYFYKMGMSVRAEANTTVLNKEPVWYVGPTLVYYLDGVPRESMQNEPQVTTKVAETPELRLTIYFDFDKFNIRQSERPKIDEAKIFLTEHPDTVAVLGGHTDSYGTADYNVNLSENRVKSVISALKYSGLEELDRIKTDFFGEKVSVEGNWTPDGRQLNRRVNICIVPSAKADQESCKGELEKSVVPMGDVKVRCVSPSEERRIEARHANTRKGGCTVHYSKGNSQLKKIASDSNHLETCHEIVRRIESQFEAAGFECQDDPK